MIFLDGIRSACYDILLAFAGADAVPVSFFMDLVSLSQFLMEHVLLQPSSKQMLLPAHFAACRMLLSIHKVVGKVPRWCAAVLNLLVAETAQQQVPSNQTRSRMRWRGPICCNKVARTSQKTICVTVWFAACGSVSAVFSSQEPGAQGQVPHACWGLQVWLCDEEALTFQWCLMLDAARC